MKCKACGYDEAAPFVRIHVPAGYIVVDKQGHEHFEYGDSFTTLYACPNCGTLRADLLMEKLNDIKRLVEEKENNRFFGCKCPWCGNTSLYEFAIHKEGRLPESPYAYTSYRMVCSCGACGPDADNETEAIEKYKKWTEDKKCLR
jgi:uncharacterized Zn finger protein